MQGRAVTAVSCGMFHTLCLVADEDETPAAGSSVWAWGADQFGDLRRVDAPSCPSSPRRLAHASHDAGGPGSQRQASAGKGRAMRGSDTAARGVAGRVVLGAGGGVGGVAVDAGEAQGERGIRLQGIVSGPCAGHSMLLLTWQLPWTLERVLWIGASRSQGPRLHVRPCLCPRAHTRTRAHAHTRTRRHRAMRCRRPGLHGEPATTDAQPGVVCHVTGLLKGSSACPLSRLPLDGPCTSFILAKILEMVSAPP